MNLNHPLFLRAAPGLLMITAISLMFALAEPALGQSADLWLEIQGEYEGEVEVGEETIEAGVQLIAVGDGKFQMRVYQNGLPGKNPDARSGASELVDAEPLKDGKIEFVKGTESVIWEDGVIKAYGNDGEDFYGELKRIERESDTLGKAPPEGATVLFADEDDGQHWKAQDEGDPVANGLLRQGVVSKQRFDGDFTLHIEFKLPFEPSKSGQARANSGIYLQGRYEVQMLDSFGLSGEDNECGGIYGVKKPSVNMCYPPERWQTYDIEFKSARFDGDEKTENARMTVYHNGVLIHEDVEVPAPTTGAPLKESAEPGFIYLQDHGSPVRYRNIWVAKQ